jgi:hypothetical protein
MWIKQNNRNSVSKKFFYVNPDKYEFSCGKMKTIQNIKQILQLINNNTMWFHIKPLMFKKSLLKSSINTGRKMKSCSMITLKKL